MKRSLWLTAALLAIALGLPSTVHAVPVGKFKGRPDWAPGKALGAWVWMTKSVVHVRFTSVKLPRHFHGKICTPRKVMNLHKFRLEPGDSVNVGPKGHCIRFSLNVKGKVDGFDFRAAGKRIGFDLMLGKAHLAPGHIWIGAGKLNPPKVPFALVRP